MALPAAGYLGDPARSTLEFQTAIDDLLQILHDIGLASGFVDGTKVNNVPTAWTQNDNTWRPVSDSVSSSDSGTSASSKAAKSAYDAAIAAQNAANSAQGTANTANSTANSANGTAWAAYNRAFETNAGAVGTYAFLRHNTVNYNISAGGLYAGSTLHWAGASIGNDHRGWGQIDGETPVVGYGTWRAMGTVNNFGKPVTLFLRVS